MRGSIISILMAREHRVGGEVAVGIMADFERVWINCVVQIDPTFELEGLPVGENWSGAGEFLTSFIPYTLQIPC